MAYRKEAISGRFGNMLGEIGMWVIYLAGAGPFGYCRGQYPEGWLVCAVLDVLVPGFPQVCQPVVGPEPRSEQYLPKGLAPAFDPPEGRQQPP